VTDQGAGSGCPDGHLSDQDWQWASAHLPIACVDVLPVQRDGDGAIRQIGLIWRKSPMGEKWCHIGGRLLYGESLLDGANRHTNDSVNGGALAAIEPQPFFVNQYFPEPREGMGLDPRKHAVAACFLAEFPSDAKLLPVGNEAIKFSWFEIDALPEEQDLWPGCSLMIENANLGSWADEMSAYEALTARCISHNELMWQTPVLAMTAIAFLMTIALSSEDDWKRALAAGLSATIAAVSAQLMAKHSSSQLADSEALSRIETRRHIFRMHTKPSKRRAPFRFKNPMPWLSKWRSRVWWFYTLALVTVTSFVIFVLALFHI
jgi:ADP-ribose pyrophosphatase YjhB (NUDIX family)